MVSFCLADSKLGAAETLPAQKSKLNLIHCFCSDNWGFRRLKLRACMERCTRPVLRPLAKLPRGVKDSCQQRELDAFCLHVYMLWVLRIGLSQHMHSSYPYERRVTPTPTIWVTRTNPSCVHTGAHAHAREGELHKAGMQGSMQEERSYGRLGARDPAILQPPAASSFLHGGFRPFLVLLVCALAAKSSEGFLMSRFRMLKAAYDHHISYKSDIHI